MVVCTEFYVQIAFRKIRSAIALCALEHVLKFFALCATAIGLRGVFIVFLHIIIVSSITIVVVA